MILTIPINKKNLSNLALPGILGEEQALFSSFDPQVSKVTKLHEYSQ